MSRATTALIAAVSFVLSSGANTVEQTVCPPVALALVLDGSGSIASTALGPINAFGAVGRGEAAMEYFAKSVLDAVQSGPKGTKSQYAAIEFDNSAHTIAGLKDDYNQVKNELVVNYRVGGGTNIMSGVVQGHNELKNARKDLAKVMLVISDGAGSDSKSSRVAAADAAKNDDITIFGFGFSGAQASQLQDISGNKAGTCTTDCNRVVSGGLTELTQFIEKGLCKTIITIIPPTPAPTPPCATPKGSNVPGSSGQNMDEEWKDCLGDLCKSFPFGNGSSKLCIQHSNAGACDDPKSPYYSVCSCTCHRCCVETPEPTPAPTDTDSPTQTPTVMPTFPDCELDFELTLPLQSNWLSAKEVLKGLFEQCNYNFDTEWQKMINDYRVKIVRNSNTYAYDGPEGIAKVPFEELVLQICMPTDFKDRRNTVETCKEGTGMYLNFGNRIGPNAWAFLLGMLLLLAKE